MFSPNARYIVLPTLVQKSDQSSPKSSLTFLSSTRRLSSCVSLLKLKPSRNVANPVLISLKVSPKFFESPSRLKLFVFSLSSSRLPVTSARSSVSPAMESCADSAPSTIALKSTPPVLLPESNTFSVSMSASFFLAVSALLPRPAMLSDRLSVLSAALSAPAAVSSIAAPSDSFISRAVAPTEATIDNSPAKITSHPAAAFIIFARFASFGMRILSRLFHFSFAAVHRACALVAAGIATAAPTAIPSRVFALGDRPMRYCATLFSPLPSDTTSGDIASSPPRAIVRSEVAVGRSCVPRSAVMFSSCAFAVVSEPENVSFSRA